MHNTHCDTATRSYQVLRVTKPLETMSISEKVLLESALEKDRITVNPISGYLRNRDIMSRSKVSCAGVYVCVCVCASHSLYIYLFSLTHILSSSSLSITILLSLSLPIVYTHPTRPPVTYRFALPYPSPPPPPQTTLNP